MSYVENSKVDGRKTRLKKFLQALKKQYGAYRHYTPRQVSAIADKLEISGDVIIDVFAVVCTKYDFAITHFRNEDAKYDKIREELSDFLEIAEEGMDCQSVLEFLTEEIDVDFDISDRRKKKSDTEDRTLKYMDNKLGGLLRDEVTGISGESDLESSGGSEGHEDMI